MRIRASDSSSAASTSKQPPPPSLPSRPHLREEFKQNADFISFSELLGDEDRGSSRRSAASGQSKWERNENGRLGGVGGQRGQKRSIGEVLKDKGKERLKDVETSTPWTADVDWDRHSSAIQQLTAEVKAFVKYVRPSEHEHQLRMSVINDVRRLVMRRWHDAHVHAFGSFETRLYLPNGDIDLVILSSSISSQKPQQKKILYLLSSLLTQSNIGKDIIVIAKARVPIVKFVSVKGNFKVDISLNMTNGMNVSRRVSQLFKEVGEDTARALIFVVKAFLSQRNMNEVYTGGLGSYSIICMVVSFLQLHPKLQRKEIKAWDNLGTLLIEFLEVYGKNFNYDDVGICLANGGSYYSKSRRGWARSNQPYLLSVEDPADPANDVSGGSHNIISVRQSIAGAFEVLTAAVFQRTSVFIARIAAAQSGIKLPILSGGAIPCASRDEANASDKCRRSILGAILGITGEMSEFRQDLRKLAGLPENIPPSPVPSSICNARQYERDNADKQPYKTAKVVANGHVALPAIASRGVEAEHANGSRHGPPHAYPTNHARSGNSVISGAADAEPKQLETGAPIRRYIDIDSLSPEPLEQEHGFGDRQLSDRENDEGSRYGVTKSPDRRNSIAKVRQLIISDSDDDSELEEGQVYAVTTKSDSKKAAATYGKPATYGEEILNDHRDETRTQRKQLAKVSAGKLRRSEKDSTSEEPIFKGSIPR